MQAKEGDTTLETNEDIQRLNSLKYAIQQKGITLHWITRVIQCI